MICNSSTILFWQDLYERAQQMKLRIKGVSRSRHVSIFINIHT